MTSFAWPKLFQNMHLDTAIAIVVPEGLMSCCVGLGPRALMSEMCPLMSRGIPDQVMGVP